MIDRQKGHREEGRERWRGGGSERERKEGRREAGEREREKERGVGGVRSVSSYVTADYNITPLCTLVYI